VYRWKMSVDGKMKTEKANLLRIGLFKSSLARIGSLFLRKKVGTKKWKILVEYED